MSSVKTNPRVGARPSTRSSPKIARSTSPGASTVAATRSSASLARSRLLTLTFDISQLLGPRNWAMAGGSNGYRAALVRRRLTPGLISSLPATAGLPPFISFSTSYPELDSAVRRPMRRIGKGGGNISRSPNRAVAPLFRGDPVAHDLVHRALVAVDGFHHAFQYRIEELACLLGVAVGEQLHRALERGED